MKHNKKYNIIYADPPWQYKNVRKNIVNIRGNSISKNTKQGRVPYDTLSLESIKDISVKSISSDDSVLFLWTTTPYLQKAMDVINAWGFNYKTIAFCWLKTYKAKKPKSLEYYMSSVYGMNYYTKLNFELCLMAVKGKMTPISHKVSGQIIAPRREHSRKPDEARERILHLFGDLPRIELFAREKVDGWDSWGNEVESDIQL